MQIASGGMNGTAQLNGGSSNWEGSGRSDVAAERNGGGSASISGKEKAEWGEGGELVSFADLKFSRVIGEVRSHPTTLTRVAPTAALI